MRYLFPILFTVLVIVACSGGDDSNYVEPTVPETPVSQDTTKTDTIKADVGEDADSGLPARYHVAKMNILTDGGVAVDGKEKADYRHCTIDLQCDTSAWNYTGTARIRGRGNSSWLWYPKKPYRLKLDEKAGILGLDANKDWVLLANYRDPTHLMNTFVFEIGHGVGLKYTNHSRYVELTINGEYLGLYQLTEQVETGKSRVDISEKDGWLISLDADDGPELSPGADDNFWSVVYRLPVCLKSPSATPEKLNEARELFAELENVILGHDYVNLEKVMDIESMIYYLLIQEYVYNVEVAAPRSIFLYRAKNEDSRWHFGPLWDFDAGFDFDWGQMYTGHYFFKDYRETVLGTDPANHISNYTYVNSFFTDMWHSRVFVSQVRKQWREMRPRIMAEFWPEAKRYAQGAAEAMARDQQLWKSRDPYFDRDYKTELNRMEKWLNSRTVYMDNIVNGYPSGL